MELSVFDLFKIGIGPSSSHTVGPMRAALRFATGLKSTDRLPGVARVRCDLYGSLALTGKGHATDSAVLLGLSGEDPETVDPDTVAARIDGAVSLGLFSGASLVAEARGAGLAIESVREGLPAIRGSPDSIRESAAGRLRKRGEARPSSTRLEMEVGLCTSRTGQSPD